MTVGFFARHKSVDTNQVILRQNSKAFSQTHNNYPVFSTNQLKHLKLNHHMPK